MTKGSPIKKFICKTLMIAVPFVLLLVLYLLTDVFKVIYDYDAFYAENEKPGVGLNAGYISTVTFEKRHAVRHYDSFIFGNSRSMCYEVAEWKRYLPDSSSCLHFDASSESLYGLYKKVLYIDKSGNPLSNALLILDMSVLEQEKSKDGHLYCIPPQLEDYRNVFRFHCSFVEAFFNPKFLYAWVDFKLSGEVKEYMTKSYLLSGDEFQYDKYTNEVCTVKLEQEIADDIFYDEEKMKVFEGKSFPDSVSPPVIKNKQWEMLSEIQRIFKKHHTRCKIVINPLFDQIKLSPRDVEELRSLFGEKNVFDFSGTNEITTDYHNYYEDSHYRPHIARFILKEIYTYSTLFGPVVQGHIYRGFATPVGTNIRLR